MRTHFERIRRRKGWSGIASRATFALFASFLACSGDWPTSVTELDLARSSLIVSPGPYVAGQPYAILFSARTSDGSYFRGPISVVLSLSGGTSGGTFSPVTELGAADHAAVFLANTAGTATQLRATIAGKGELVAPQAISVVPGPANEMASFIRGSTQNVLLGETATFTVTVRDWQMNVRTGGGDTVSFRFTSETPPSGVAADGTFSTVRDNGDGTYSTTFTGTRVGQRYVNASIAGVNLRGTSAGVTVRTPPP